MISEPNEIGENINEHFINLEPHLVDKIPTSLRNFNSYSGESKMNPIFLNPITINEVAREIDN